MNANLTRPASPNLLPLGLRSSLFDGLAPSEINALLAAARKRRFPPHEVIQREGEPATGSFLLATGRAVAYKLTPEGERVFLHWIVPGDAFGFTAPRRKPPPCVATVQTLRESLVLVWDWESSLALTSQFPQLRGNACAAMANHLASVSRVLVARCSQTARQRLARMLVESADQIGRTGSEGIEIDLTNEDLADMAGVSLFTASRQLSEWQRKGILAKRRGRILLHSRNV